jgi:uncharacterized coiled-coil protein SlyX
MSDHPVEMHQEMLDRLQRCVDAHDTRLGQLEKVSAAREEQVKNLYQTVGEIKQICADIKEQVQLMVVNMDAKLAKAIEDIDNRLKPLEEADGRKWKQLSTFALGAVVTGVLGYLIGKVL